jgi:hypothetical protein
MRKYFLFIFLICNSFTPSSALHYGVIGLNQCYGIALVYAEKYDAGLSERGS